MPCNCLACAFSPTGVIGCSAQHGLPRAACDACRAYGQQQQARSRSCFALAHHHLLQTKEGLSSADNQGLRRAGAESSSPRVRRGSLSGRAGLQCVCACRCCVWPIRCGRSVCPASSKQATRLLPSRTIAVLVARTVVYTRIIIKCFRHNAMAPPFRTTASASGGGAALGGHEPARPVHSRTAPGTPVWMIPQLNKFHPPSQAVRNTPSPTTHACLIPTQCTERQPRAKRTSLFIYSLTRASSGPTKTGGLTGTGCWGWG